MAARRSSSSRDFAPLRAHLQLLFFIGCALLFFLLVQPVITAFLTSIILAYVSFPIYRKLRSLVTYETLASLLTLFVIALIFIIPLLILVAQIPGQAVTAYEHVNGFINDNSLLDFDCESEGSLQCSLSSLIDLLGLRSDRLFSIFFGYITQTAASIALSIPGIIAGIGLILFISFFLFKDGKKLTDSLILALPLSHQSSQKLITHFGNITYSVVFAHLIVAFAQGAAGAIGFYLFGIPSPLFWGMIMALLALLPILGTPVIWIPASAILLIQGITTDSTLLIVKGVGLFIYGLLIISTLDNILRAKLVGGRSHVHPITVIIGLVGGISLFGIPGVFIGPILLSLLITFFQEFSQKYKKKEP